MRSSSIAWTWGNEISGLRSVGCEHSTADVSIHVISGCDVRGVFDRLGWVVLAMFLGSVLVHLGGLLDVDSKDVRDILLHTVADLSCKLWSYRQNTGPSMCYQEGKFVNC